MPLSLTSSAFPNNGTMPVIYTCDGKNISPPLDIIGIPFDARSLVLIMEDPDAPAGTWDHWVIYDISAKTKSVAEGEEPTGTHGKGSGDNLTYMGPCPHGGVHRYVFTLYALDEILSLPEGLKKSDVLMAVRGHILEEAQLTGRYGRKI